MGSRTSSQLDFRNSQSDFATATAGPPFSRLDLDTIRNSTKSLAASLDLETRLQQDAAAGGSPATARHFTPEMGQRRAPSGQRDIPAAAVPAIPLKISTPTTPAPAAATTASYAKTFGKVALDANQNATAASLPTAPQPPKARSKGPRQPDPLVEMFPKECCQTIILKIIIFTQQEIIEKNVDEILPVCLSDNKFF
jgi:hypothetical protein